MANQITNKYGYQQEANVERGQQGQQSEEKPVRRSRAAKSPAKIPQDDAKSGACDAQRMSGDRFDRSTCAANPHFIAARARYTTYSCAAVSGDR
jgi:hypothetical protein